MRIGVVKGILAAVLSLAAFGALPGSAGAATDWQSCFGGYYPITCATYDMPLDRTGAVPGTTKVRVIKESAPEGPRMGTIFVIAGGPGQTSQVMIGLMEQAFAGANRYDIVAVDQRGSGQSEPLDCPRLESLAFDWDGGDPRTDGPFTNCSNALGAPRASYNTAEAVADLDDIRADMGVDNAVFFGVSYGTKVALAYAKAHPNHTKSLILDSVLPTDMPGAFDTESLAALRGAMKTICTGGRCKQAGGVPTANLEKLAKQLDKDPIPSFLVSPTGKIEESKIDANALYDIVFQADFDLYIYNQLPSMVSSAVRGNTAQLERLYAIVNGVYASDEDYGAAKRSARKAKALGLPKATKPKSVKTGDRVIGRDAATLAYFSNTMFFATTCADFNPPWARSTDVAGRQTAIDAAVNAIPSSKLKPFPRKTVRDNSTAAYCRGWQQNPSLPAIDQGPLPNIPTLALAGTLDLRTPVSWAEQAVAGNPSAQVVKIPNTGHSTVGTDLSGCALSLATRFLIYGGTDGKCKKTADPVPIAPRTPSTLNGVDAPSGSCRNLSRSACKRAKKTLAAGYLAVRDALDQSMIGGTDTGPGLLGGEWHIEYDIDEYLNLVPIDIRMYGLTSVPGAFASGSIALEDLPYVDDEFRIGPYRASMYGRIAYNRSDDSLTITGKRGRGRVSIRIKSKGGASAAFAPTLKQMKLRRNYALASARPFKLLPR